MEYPQHGDERSHEIERVIDTCSMREQTVSERWCGHCRRWIRVAGVTGALAFMAEHDDGDCVKSRAQVKTKTYSVSSVTADSVLIAVTCTGVADSVHRYERRRVRVGCDQLLRVSEYFAQRCGAIEGRTKAAMLQAIEEHLGVPLPSRHEWDPKKKRWSIV